jgi:hypothetical protein
MNDLCKEVIKAAFAPSARRKIGKPGSGGRNVVFLKVYSARFEGSRHFFSDKSDYGQMSGEKTLQKLCVAPSI